MAFLANVIATIEQSELASIEMTMARKFSIDMLPNPKPMPRALHRGHHLSLESLEIS